MSTFAPTTKAQLQTAITAWITTGGSTTVGTPTASYNAVTINSWNVSAITDMSSLFTNKTTFNSNISGWNVINVTTMQAMFSGATSFNQPLNAWNVSNVSTMHTMFAGAAYNQPLGLWNVGKVTNMTRMFDWATAFNQPIDSWNVSSVTNMSSLFNGSPFNQSLNSWNVSNVTNMSSIFGETPFNGNITSWNVSQVTNMSNMFKLAPNFNQPIGSWNVGNVTTMGTMFIGATLFNQDISNWNVSRVTTMTSMFQNATAFNRNIRTWYVGSVTAFTTMFSGATQMLAATPTGQGATDTPTAAYFNQPVANTLPVGKPTISGSVTQGQILTASTLGITDADTFLGPFAYQWYSNNILIAGATSSTYLLAPADAGKTITVIVNYLDGRGTTEYITSDATVQVVGVNTAPAGLPTISGTAAQGQTLTAVTSGITDANGLGSFAYQWKRAGAAISGATGSTYSLVQADVGSAITVTVSYTDGSNFPESLTSAATASVTNVNDAPTGAVTIAGTVQQGFTLTASNNLVDPDGPGGAVSYAWKRNGISIVGANSSTYPLTELDVGYKMSVVASYTDGGGYPNNIISAETVAVVNVNDPLTGSVTIAGTATQGQLLTASNTFTDADGMGTVSYQWKRAGAAISGATSSTYTLVQADVGLAITVTASYTDGRGTAESATSAATASVSNVNDSPTGSVTITGTPTQNQVLTANTSGLSDLDGLGAFSYQWMRTGSNISGATASTYTLVQADVGQAISVKVSYTDVFGAAENKTSAETAAVANVNDSPTGDVTITGTPTQNQVLTASNTLADVDGLGPITYQWKCDGAAISGATGDTYTLTQAEVGKYITVVASYTDGFGGVESVPSLVTAAVVNVNDIATGRPIITGITTQGQVLTANTSGISDLDGLGTFLYQWHRKSSDTGQDDSLGLSAISATYTLVQADVGNAMYVKVSYSDGYGSFEVRVSDYTALIANANDSPSGSVTITGTPTQNQILTVSNTLGDLDGLGPITYQWKRDLIAISGATGTTYTLLEADVGKYITVTASYTDGFGAAESKTSSSTVSIANVNDSPTGSVTISGTPTQGQLLTASNTLVDVDGLGPITYQWKRGVTAISGATGATYTLVQADVGSAITVTASYTDLQGTPESVTSAATSEVANVNDSPTGDVTISGTPTQYQVLTAITSGLSDLDGLGAFSYQWMRDGSNISGATASTYTLVQADVGQAISVKVSYTDGFGAAESKTSAATALVANVNDLPTGSVTIAGIPTQYQVLTVSHTLGDVDGLGPITYQWKSGGVAISGATGTSYALTQAEVGKIITVTASYTDLQGIPESVTSAATTVVANVNDPLTGDVTISGTPTQKQVLTAITSGLSDLDGLGAFSYQWMRAGSNISGATASTYTLVQADVGQAISVKVSYTDLQGTPESKTSVATASVANVNDLPTGSVTISGTPTQNQVLTVSHTLGDLDGLGPITYQWKRDGTAVSGATGTTYTLTEVDVGRHITVLVSYTDLQGTPESYESDSTLSIANVNDPLIGDVTIAGTPTQYQVLTASNTFTDVDGMGTVSYQWKRGGVAISGAISSTYTLVQADVGSAITVTASYTDGHGTAESKTSAATAAVANVNDSPTGAVTISGTPTQYQVLTVSNTLVDIDGLGPITYQWKRAGSNISGATSASYALTQADVGSSITVTASYTDVFGAAESKTSAATTAVANVNDSPTGSVTITGTPTQNQVLTVSNTLTDIDGLGPITYQWKRNGLQIASGTTYTLVQADVGSAITVTASYTDLLGTNESVTSAATALIANVNDPLVGHVMIDGDLTQGQTLTASNNFSDVDGFSTAVSYQWMKNGVQIGGRVGSTYTLTPDDIGAKISVTASYTDGYGAQEQKTSAETYPIQPIRGAYSLLTKGIETMSLRAAVNGKIIIATPTELVLTSSNTAGALSAMTSVENSAWIKHNASALLSKYASSLGSNKLYVSKSLLPFAATSPLTDKVELIDAKSSSVASPLVRVRDASMGAFYMDTQPGNSVTLTYSTDTIVITHTSESAFTVAINGGAAVNKSIGDKILLKNVVLTLGSITGEPNNLPVFVQNAPTTVFEDASYSYTVSVSDLDNDTFTVTAPILPSWLTFSAGTLSCLSVPSSVVGSHPVQFLAEDIWGGKTYYDFTITVQNVLVTGTVTSSASLKYSDLNTVQTPILKAVQVSESDATVVINNATVNGVDVRSYLQLGVGPSNYTVTVKSGQHAALLTLLRSNPGNVSVAIKITDISAQTSPIYVIETITVLNDSPTTTQQFPSSMTIIEDSATAYAQSGGTDSVITFSEACSVVLNGTYKDYFMLVATDGTSRTYKLKCKDLASARAIIPGTSYSLTVTATSSANALTVTSNSLSVQATNILTTAIVGGAKILTHASLQAYITSSAVIPNIATITLSESDPQSITLQTVTVNGSSVDKTYFTMSGSAGNYVLSVNTSAASQLLTRLSALITSSSAYNMLMTFQVVEQGGNAFTQTITVAASNNIIKVSLKSTVTNVPNMVSYSVNGSVATVVMNYSATPVIDYVDYIISDANSAIGTRLVGGGIAYDGTTLPTMYVGVSLVKSMVYQSPGEWIVTYNESYSGITGSQSNTLTLKFSVRGAINFVLPALNASFELLQALSFVGNYDAPDTFALPTITLPMSASQFNDGLFHLELVDSNIHTLTETTTEAVHFSEKIIYYTDNSKFPILKSIGDKHLREVAVVNGSAHASTHLRQRNADADGLGASMVHELAYQLTGVSLMDDQLANGVSLRSVIDDYITTALPASLKSKIADCNGKTQNISGASDMTDRRNIPRELFMQIVESVVGDRHGMHVAKSSRLNTLFHPTNLAGGKYGIKFIAGDTLRFTVTISPSANAIDYIVDGMPHAVQEARAVEVIITMM
jgi:surface protein